MGADYTTAELDRLFRSLSNWGRWGDDDERGCAAPPHGGTSGGSRRAGADRTDGQPGPQPRDHAVAREPVPRASPHARRRRRAGQQRHTRIRSRARLRRIRRARPRRDPCGRALAHVRTGTDVRRASRVGSPQRRGPREHRDVDGRRRRGPGRAARHSPDARRRVPRERRSDTTRRPRSRGSGRRDPREHRRHRARGVGP